MTPGARAEHFECLGVWLDPLGELTTGQRSVSEERRRGLVLCRFERAHQQVAIVGRKAQLSRHSCRRAPRTCCNSGQLCPQVAVANVATRFARLRRTRDRH